MIVLLCASLAFAHGGEHVEAAPVAVVSAGPAGSAGAVHISASTEPFEAVLRVAHPVAGEPAAMSLLVADYASSAPVVDAAATVTLAGPVSVPLTFTPGASPGIYAASAVFPTAGDYAGALVVTTPERSGILALTGLRIGGPVTGGMAAESGTGSHAGMLARRIGGAALLLAMVGIGYALGRRRGGVVAGLLGALTVRAVWAHGGEDHGPASGPTSGPTSGSAATGPQSAALNLPMESQFLIGLRTARVVEGTFQARTAMLARFVSRPGGSATLRAPVSGELVAPTAGFPTAGSSVRVGQVLAILRTPVGSPDRVALAEARLQATNAVSEARRALALAERDAAQIPNLLGGISERDRLDREQSVEVARSAVTAAQAALSAIGTEDSLIVRAPVSGRLGPTQVRPGDQVQAGDALFRVLNADGIWLEAQVPERAYAAGARTLEGAAARVTASALPDAQFDAVVLDAGQEADPATGSFTVTLAVESTGEGAGLRPGMSGTAWLGAGDARPALLLPDSAVVESDGIYLGFVKVGPEAFETRTLRLGARSDRVWEVIDGVRAGERVVTDGTYALRSLTGR